MANTIHDIQKFTVMDREMYFLDSNVWIWYLMAEQFGDDILKKDKKNWEKQRHYVDFVRSIVTLNTYTDKKTIKALTHQPKIVITSLLLSELINVYLRLLMKDHIDDLPTDKERNEYTFKKFRDTLYYQEQHRYIISVFQEMSPFLHFIDDEFNTLKPLELLANLTDKHDFNDFYYYNLLKNKNITVVTDDGDFKFEDIEIVTYRYGLINLNKRM